MKNLFYISILLFCTVTFNQTTKNDVVEVAIDTIPSIPPDTISPLVINKAKIYNFRITDAHKKRVYFDSDEPITATNFDGFTISGKTITTFNSLENYFTVSSAFDFWDNNTIRYKGGSDFTVGASTLLEFTLEYIKNQIPEPEISGTDYYVTTKGNDSNNGLSEKNAFKTISKGVAKVKEGGTLWIKAGTYNVNVATQILNSGTVNNPIKIIGYKTTLGDISSTYYTYTEGSKAPTLDGSEMPLMEGNQGNFTALYMSGNSYVIIKNMQFQNTFNGLKNNGTGTGFIVENCIAKNMYGSGAEEGSGFLMGDRQTRSTPYPPSYNRIKNSISINGGVSNIDIVGSHGLVESCYTYCDATGGSGVLGSDYFITAVGDNNIVRNSRAATIDGTVNPASHGIGAKATEWNYTDVGITTTFNLFEFNFIKTGSQESIYSRNVEANYNVHKDITIEGFPGAKNRGIGITNQSGAQNNTYERITGSNLFSAFAWVAGTESGTDPKKYHTNSNIIRNSTFISCNYLQRYDRVLDIVATFKNNKVYDNTFSNIDAFSRGHDATLKYWNISSNEFTNNIMIAIIMKDYGSKRPLVDDFYSVQTNSKF